ncbi:hypothetical protein BKA61DRAFT_665017 [Leptodontidium sp. MPI-SDFR-AT-0119]|nr:hypothetical protein BKA61DRAFT_665017 [Leptodontidium sp. MPI-SDFR-AT-0119]
MAPRSLDSDLSSNHHVVFSSTPPPRSKLNKGFFSLDNPGFVLVLYNFLFALPLAYILTHLNKSIISWIGYEKIMRCPSGIIFSRLLFVALNMWLVVSWGLQLEKEARDRKGRRLESVREEVAWWEGEVERLEGVLGGVRQREVEEQLLRESPSSGPKNGFGSSFMMIHPNGSRSGTVSPKAVSSAGHQVIEEAYDSEEEDEGEDEDSRSEESSEDDDGDSEWNGVD